MDYLDWQSEVSLDQVFADGEQFSYPSIASNLGTLYLTKSRGDNRSILKLKSKRDNQSVTPAPFNLQTRVNEYGGKPFWVFESSVVFANRSDQCLYRQEFQRNKEPLGPTLSAPERISLKPSADKRLMYTDVHELNEFEYVSIVEVECSAADHANNRMFIGTFSRRAEAAPIVLIDGADFYSNLVINPAKNKVAWVQWNHPAMPWDDTELWVADLVFQDGEASFQNVEQLNVSISRGGGASICQLLFSNNDRLFFSADYQRCSGSQKDTASGKSVDANNYWNVHVYDFTNQEIKPVTSDAFEYGYPHWVYGDHRIVQFTDTQLLTVASAPEGDALVLIDQVSLESTRFRPDAAPSTLQHLNSDGSGVCVLEELGFGAGASVIKLTLPESVDTVNCVTVIASTRCAIDVSSAQPISFSTADGEQAHGFYYPPTNQAQQALTSASALPPLLVMVHGGPTARAYGHFDLQKQFWTSRGFAILDVNHRGSTGYGRAFRDSLYGYWGERDTSDIVDGVRHLIDQAKVDPERICIRGKSAGGYAVLRALTEYPELFRVGACYYGIGNLITLAEATHKFEKHYTDRLIDEVFDAEHARMLESKFHQRSPINKMTELNSAMIVFQGALDRVVPPSVAQEIIQVLVDANIDHEYVEYSDEAHGFKQADNNIDAWKKELAFYQRVLRHSVRV